MPMRKATAEELKYVKECRNYVKGANFALLYGGGKKTLAAALRQADATMSEKDSLKLASKLIAFKKGNRDEEGNFYGGSDSVVYNAMYATANSHTPTLPALGTKISEALRPSMVGDDFITGRTNFCIQAAGAEMLATITVALFALCKKYNIEAYYCISIHDELHYIVKEEHSEMFCALMNLAHFYSWNFFHERYGVSEFPWQRAFFDDISIRHCVCKEANDSLATLSNPEGANEPTGQKIDMKYLLQNKVFEQLAAHSLL